MCAFEIQPDNSASKGAGNDWGDKNLTPDEVDKMKKNVETKKLNDSLKKLLRPTGEMIYKIPSPADNIPELKPEQKEVLDKLNSMTPEEREAELKKFGA